MTPQPRAFVYRWRNLRTREWYIGYHCGTESDGYICSSSIALPLIRAQPHEWQRRILRWGTKAEMVALEHRLLKRLRAKTNPRSLNRSNGWRDTIVSRRDLLGYDLDRMTAREIVERLTNETDPRRRLVIHQWLMPRVVQSITEQKSEKPMRK